MNALTPQPPPLDLPAAVQRLLDEMWQGGYGASLERVSLKETGKSKKDQDGWVILSGREFESLLAAAESKLMAGWTRTNEGVSVPAAGTLLTQMQAALEGEDPHRHELVAYGPRREALPSDGEEYDVWWAPMYAAGWNNVAAKDHPEGWNFAVFPRYYAQFAPTHGR